ncbi:MAG: cobalamin-binding protein [Dehalococcoidia bacterium]
MFDALGQEFESGRRARIVSLVPSLTETLFTYGLGASVVGATRYCVEPAAAVEQLAKVGGTKNPELEAIVVLRPDLIIASAEENRKEDIEALIDRGLSVFVTMPATVMEAWRMLVELAQLLDAEEQARPMLAELEQTLAELQGRAEGNTAVRYFCPIWRRPFMTSGPDTYAYDLLRLCGGTSVCGEGEARYFAVDLAEVAAARPEVILLPDEPYPFSERHKADFAPYHEMPAVANGRIYCIDGKLLTWYGQRTAGGIRMMQRLLVRTAPERTDASGLPGLF